MSPEIIYEDDLFLVIDKPSGLVVHPFDFSQEETLLSFLHTHAPEIFSIENYKKLQDGRMINLGGIVHKLDRDTSGVMVIAKTKEVFNQLQTQFSSHSIQKEYIALVDGLVEEDSFTINAPLGRNKKDYRQVANPHNPRGELRDAITGVEIIKRNNKNNTTLLNLFPKTGRTHQLRAHMTYINHPIIGDKIYGNKETSSRLLLHARKLSFTYNGEQFSFETETPKEFLV